MNKRLWIQKLEVEREKMVKVENGKLPRMYGFLHLTSDELEDLIQKLEKKL
jgi:hypothetical protein